MNTSHIHQCIFQYIDISKMYIAFQQHREYEKIFTTLQSRPQSIAIKAEPDIVEDKEKEEEQPFQFGLGASLGPRRSRSHSILHVSLNGFGIYAELYVLSINIIIEL